MESLNVLLGIIFMNCISPSRNYPLIGSKIWLLKSKDKKMLKKQQTRYPKPDYKAFVHKILLLNSFGRSR
jgi:hypothetical protein